MAQGNAQVLAKAPKRPEPGTCRLFPHGNEVDQNVRYRPGHGVYLSGPGTGQSAREREQVEFQGEIRHRRVLPKTGIQKGTARQAGQRRFLCGQAGLYQTERLSDAVRHADHRRSTRRPS